MISVSEICDTLTNLEADLVVEAFIEVTHHLRDGHFIVGSLGSGAAGND